MNKIYYLIYNLQFSSRIVVFFVKAFKNKLLTEKNQT